MFQSLLLTCLLGISAVSAQATAMNLPEVGSGLNRVVSTQEEIEMGQAYLKLLKASVKQYNDPFVKHYLHTLVNDIDPTVGPLSVVVIDDPKLNAFATPGGVIGVNIGLLLNTQYEDELVAVLAHEVAHLKQRHYARMQERQAQARPLAILGMMAGIVAGSQDAQLGSAMMSSVMAKGQSDQMAFSQDMESEADRIGFQLMLKRGDNPMGMPRMFKRLHDHTRFNQPQGMMSTHPLSLARLSDIQNRAAQVKASVKPDSVSFKIARTHVFAHLNKPLPQFETDDSQRLYYSWLKGRSEGAQATIASLNTSWVGHSYLGSLRAAELIKSGNVEQAIEQLSSLPQALRHQTKASLYLKAGNYDQAITSLKAHLGLYPKDEQGWYQLAEAYGKVGNIAALHEARIKYFMLVADYEAAKHQVLYALKNRQLSDTAADDLREWLHVIKSEKDLMTRYI